MALDVGWEQAVRARWFPVIVLTACLASAPAPAARQNCSHGSPADAKALAAKAAVEMETLGYRQAFENFMDPQGEFFPHDLYVFVVDLEGNVWVNGAFPQAIGTNALGAEDAKGRRYIEQMLRLAARDGEGRIEYQALNPCTGEYTDKITFFKRVGVFVVAVGAYGSITAGGGGARLINAASAPRRRESDPVRQWR